MGLKRWWAERRNPALKCARMGHAPAIETRTGWKSSEGRHVMDKVRQERRACCCCGLAMGSWKTVARDGYDSVSWPDEIWDEYRANGNERWTDHGWLPEPSPNN